MATYQLRTTPCCRRAEQGSTFVYEFTDAAPSATCGYCGAVVVEAMARTYAPPVPERRVPEYRECDMNADRGEYYIRGSLDCEGMGPRAAQPCPFLEEFNGDERPCICCDACRVACLDKL